MQTEVIRINCSHCKKEYMTDRWDISTECNDCSELYVINSDNGYAVVDSSMHTQLKRVATVFTRARAEQHIDTLTTFHVNNNYRVERL